MNEALRATLVEDAPIAFGDEPAIAAGVDTELDSLGIRGEVTFRGRRTEPFVMSNRFRDYRWNGTSYERPPHHINPIRRGSWAGASAAGW